MSITVCLNAGHHGKCNRSPANHDYYESEMAWKLHKLVGKELEKMGVKVKYTRNTIDENPSITSRGKMAEGCDAYYSFHSNSVAGGVVKEGTDYPVCIITTDGSTIRSLAASLATTIASVMETTQKGKVWTKLSSNGSEYYGELRGCASVGVSGIIIEHSFHTCPKSVEWLMSDSNLSMLAKIEARMIAEYHGVTIGEDSFDITVKELYNGITDNSVKAIQRILIFLGYDLGAGKDDGIFGDMTEAAVSLYQLRNGLPLSGVVDEETYCHMMGLVK